MNAEAQARFNDIAGTLKHINDLANEVEVQLSVLRINATNYAEAVAAAKKAGSEFPPYSGSDAQAQVAKLVPRINAAANQVGFIGTEMQRFSS
ncbi:MAG: hypothetical protein KA535_11215 [Azonexus sp.]|nr:hypothetical protein [Azonexus sp.]